MDLNDIDQWSRALLQNEARKRGVRTPEVYSRGELIRLILRHDYGSAASVRGAARFVGGLLGTAKVALKVGLSRLEPERLPRGWERRDDGRDRDEYKGWKDTSSGFDRAAPVDASLATSPGVEVAPSADVAQRAGAAEQQATASSSGSLSGATPTRGAAEAESQTFVSSSGSLRGIDSAYGPAAASEGARPAAALELGRETAEQTASASSGASEGIAQRGGAREPHVAATSRGTSPGKVVWHEDTALSPWDEPPRSDRTRAEAPGARDASPFEDEGLTEPQPTLAAAVARGAADVEVEELVYGPHPAQGMHVRWRVGSDAIHRARAVLGAHGELAVRVIAVRVEDSSNVRTETLDHGPVESNGDWTAPLAPTAARYVTSVGLRSGDRFVSIVHAASN